MACFGIRYLIGDVHLLDFRIARELDDFHTIAQRFGNRVQPIRRGHEEHLRKIERHVEVVIPERVVLLGIENLHQCRRRIAAEIASELIHFVQHEHRIVGLGAAQTLNDLPGQCADIGPAMAADLRFVVHAAQRDADELASERPGDGLAERGFAHARRPDKAEDRTLHTRLKLLHGQVVEDPLLDLFEVVVILVEDRLALDEVDVLGARGLGPRQRGHPFQIGPRHHVLGRGRRHLLQPLQLAVAFLASFRRHARFVQLLAQLLDFGLGIVRLTEFLLNGLHLLAQQILALALADLLLHLLLNFVAQLEHLELFRELADQSLQAPAYVGGFEQFLAQQRGERRQIGRDEVGQPHRLVDIQRNGLQIVGELRRPRHHVPEKFASVALERGQFGIASAHHVLDRFDPCAHERLQSNQRHEANPCNSLDKNDQVAVRQLDRLVELGHRADAVQIHIGRILHSRDRVGR